MFVESLPCQSGVAEVEAASFMGRCGRDCCDGVGRWGVFGVECVFGSCIRSHLRLHGGSSGLQLASLFLEECALYLDDVFQSAHECFIICIVIVAISVALLGLGVGGIMVLALGCWNRLCFGLLLPASLGFAFDEEVGLAGPVVVVYLAPDVWS